MTTNRQFYVYMYYRPWDGSPCYVGKGTRDRWLSHAKYGVRLANKNFANIFKKAQSLGLEVLKSKIRENLTEQEAFEIEISIIKLIGRKENGGPLVNLTDGGEGVSGLVCSDEQRKRMSVSARERWKSPESRQHYISYFASMTPEDRAARRKKISETTRQAMQDPSVKAKISNALTGRVHDDARRELTSRTVRQAYADDPTIGQRAAKSRALRDHKPFAGHHHSVETRMKMSMTRLMKNLRLQEECH